MVTVGGLGVLAWPRGAEVATFRQPESVVYPDGLRHIAVLRRVRSLGAAVGVGGEHYEVLLGASHDYGHIVRFDATDVETDDVEVAWETEGAWLDYGSGHRVFVPAEEFLGGR